MVSELLTEFELDDTWCEADLTGVTSCFVIAIKEAPAVDDTIDVSKVTKIGFELGIDGGLVDVESNVVPLSTQYLILDFNDITSTDESVNKTTAFSKLTGVPTTLYIKPVFADVNGIRTYEGKTSIKINISK